MSNSFECHECGAKRARKNVYAYEVYDSPWQEKPDTIYVCRDRVGMQKNLDYHGNTRYYESCEELLTDTSWADFRYFECDGCHRMVISQCPSNGWHSYVRYDYDLGEQVCLKCFEEQQLAEGANYEQLRKNTLPGMFFDTDDLENAGFKPIEHFESRFVGGTDDAEPICRKAMSLMDAGRKVVVNYERMAIGGLEGYVTLWASR